MAQKRINTIVVEAKDSIVKTVNDCIKQGLPSAMVSIMLEGILMDLNNNVKKVLEAEQKEYEKELKTEKNQVKYVPEQNGENKEQGIEILD